MSEVNPFLALVGRTIHGIRRNPSGEVVAFDTDGGPYAFETNADCCNGVWFSDFIGVSCALGGTVTRTEVLGQVEHPTEQGMGVYGFHIHTDRGTLHLEMRNETVQNYTGWVTSAMARNGEATIPVGGDLP